MSKKFGKDKYFFKKKLFKDKIEFSLNIRKKLKNKIKQFKKSNKFVMELKKKSKQSRHKCKMKCINLQRIYSMACNASNV